MTANGLLSHHDFILYFPSLVDLFYVVRFQLGLYWPVLYKQGGMRVGYGAIAYCPCLLYRNILNNINGKLLHILNIDYNFVLLIPRHISNCLVKQNGDVVTGQWVCVQCPCFSYSFFIIDLFFRIDSF